MHCSTRRSPGSGPMTVTLCLLGLMILQVSSLPTPKVQRDDPSQPEIWPVSNICGFQTTPAANCDCDSLLDHDARDAYCTIYKMTEKRHEFWDSFSTQSRLINVRFVVDSSHGQLDYVPVDAFPHLKALKVLEIRGASIETLEANTFESLKQLTELKLTGNRVRFSH